MSLPGGPEIWVYAQVDLHARVFEPSTATSSEVGRLLHLNQTEKSNVEVPGRVFLPSRHGQLDVIKAHDLQVSLQRPSNTLRSAAKLHRLRRLRQLQRIVRRRHRIAKVIAADAR